MLDRSREQKRKMATENRCDVREIEWPRAALDTNTLGSKEWFDLDLWTCDLKISRDHLLIEGNPCTKFGIDQVKGSKDTERTTHWGQEWLDLDLWTCDLKINRDHLLIEDYSCTKFGIDQVKESKDIERTTLGLQTDRPTYRCCTDKQPKTTWDCLLGPLAGSLRAKGVSEPPDGSYS